MARWSECASEAGRASCRRSSISLYTNLDQYIQDHQVFSDLAVANFRLIFLHYFLLSSLIFAVFCTHRLVKIFKKRLLFVWSKFRDYLIRFAIGLRRFTIRLCLLISRVFKRIWLTLVETRIKFLKSNDLNRSPTGSM